MNHFKVDFGEFEASRCQRYKAFIIVCNKLECLSLASLTCL
jgi:hypothetical protein